MLSRRHDRVGAQKARNERQRRHHRQAEQRAEDVVLGLEVMIKRRLSNTDGLGDGAGRGAGVAQRGEEFTCCIEDFIACSHTRPAFGLQPWAARPRDRHYLIVAY
jgi:hypothetical protein